MNTRTLPRYRAFWTRHDPASWFWWAYILVVMPLMGWGLRWVIDVLGLRA